MFSVLAIVTLLPRAAASKPNVLGYRSVCSFAPAASALCGLLAGITCTLRNRLVSRKAASARYAPPFAAVGVTLALGAIAIVFGIRFARVESRFRSVIESTSPAAGGFGVLADGIHTASASEGDIAATVEMEIVSGKINDLRLVDGRNVEASLAAQIFEAVITAQSAVGGCRVGRDGIERRPVESRGRGGGSAGSAVGDPTREALRRAS